jgi:hypothetical protein
VVERWHPAPMWSPMRLIRRVDRRRRTSFEARRLGRYGSLLTLGHDSRGRRLAVYMVDEAEQDLRFDKRRSWRHLRAVDPGPAGGEVMILSASLAGPDADDLDAMRRAMASLGWALAIGTDASPEEIRWVRRDPAVRELWNLVRRTRPHIEVHPASEGPASMRVLLHPHAWTTKGSVHIGLTAEAHPEDLGHELMHVVIADEGYPNAIRFADAGDVDTMVPLCGILDVEVDRRLRELGMTIRDTVEDAEAMMEGDPSDRRWSIHEASMILLGRLRAIPADLRPRFEAWASEALPEALPPALTLDRMLPPALDPLDVAVGVLLAGSLTGSPIGFMPAPWTVDSSERVPAWQAAVSERAATLDAAEHTKPAIVSWTVRPMKDEDWIEHAGPATTRQEGGTDG